VCEDAPCQL